ncbi:hypothetical protein MNBD_ALPHA08-197 [hydrothermal vent metagenome]|uniref:Uncharacterized protein n=1 Tax=hydrothermal vent metagenome TaxID=652676 RepID=A0A3B0SDP1_9ZZZZ
MKLFTLTMLIGSSVLLFSQPVQASHSGGGGGAQSYAIEYCRYYKTKASFAGRKARANRGVRKYGRRANALWAKYNACLKDNGWPTQYRAPVY